MIRGCDRHWIRFGGTLACIAAVAAVIHQSGDGPGGRADDFEREPTSLNGAADGGAGTRSGQVSPQVASDDESNDTETVDRTPASERQIADHPLAFAMGWPDRAEAELRFGQESKDPEWAVRTEGALLGVVGELDGLALHSIEVDCRLSMCRLVLYHPRDVDQVYSIRQIYARVAALGLGPMLAEKGFSDGGLPTLSIFLRRKAP